VIEGHVDQHELDAIKARYGIGGRAAGPGPFPVVLIQPSYYDEDGYVIQWWRFAPASESLPILNAVFEELRERRVLGDSVQIVVRAMEEGSTRIRTDRLARELKDGKGLVILAGVQPNRFSRAMDLALPLRVTGVNVCMGGLAIARNVAEDGSVTPELQEAMNLGISLYAGEVDQARMEQVLRDAWGGELKRFYNFLEERKGGEPARPVVLPAIPQHGVIGHAGERGTKLERSAQYTFSTWTHEAGREPRLRTPAEVEQLIREQVRQGTTRFFIADENLSQPAGWEGIFDRLIALHGNDGPEIDLTLQMAADCDAPDGFMEKASRAGVRRVVLGLDRLQPSATSGSGERRCLSDYRRVLREWRGAGVIVFVVYIFGFPGDTEQRVRDDISTIRRELEIDLLEPYWSGALSSSPALPNAELAAVTMTATDASAICREVWTGSCTLENIETALQRAAGTRIDLDELMELLVWFHFCVTYEKVDPLQSGHLRLKRRTDRRATMPKESFFRFYRQYGSEVLHKQAAMTKLRQRFRRFIGDLKREQRAG
jgi:hypothetical protein